MQAGHDDSWGKFHSKKNANKTFIEAILGNSADNSGREGFMRFGTKTLQFRCIWDNTDQLYGDVMEFCLKYYLADDTLEIFSIPSKLSGGKDGNKSKLLKRAKLPKNFRDTMDLQKVPEDSSFFHWSDFYIGMELKVYGRYLKIMDADGPTREFFQLAEAPLGPGLFLPEPDVVVHQREVPPPTGFGSEEDSLRSCNGPLMPGRAPAKRQGESRILSFFACLLSGGLDDVDRRFVISYYIQDGHIKITEPPIRNSGFTGGLFLSKRAVKLENGEAMKETDLFIGCRLKVLKHEFLLLDANEGTLRWMEDKSLPRSNYYSILEKIRPFLMEDAVSGALSKSFASFEKPVNHDGLGGPGYATKEDLAAILSQYNLMGQHRDDVSEHEIRTIVRGAGNRTPFFAYEKFIQQIIHPTDEFK